MKLKPGHLELFVLNPLKSREFYERSLGFRVQEIQQEQYVWMELDNLTLLLRPGSPPSPSSHYREASSGIVFYTNNLERTQEELRERGVVFRGTDGSDRCLTFTDPDGNWFQLVDPDSPS